MVISSDAQCLICLNTETDFFQSTGGGYTTGYTLKIVSAGWSFWPNDARLNRVMNRIVVARYE